MKKVLVGILAVLFLNTAVIASEWWQVNGGKCVPVAGNMSPYEMKKTIIENNGSFKFILKNDDVKVYIFKMSLSGDASTVATAEGYNNCIRLISLMKENGLL